MFLSRVPGTRLSLSSPFASDQTFRVLRLARHAAVVQQSIVRSQVVCRRAASVWARSSLRIKLAEHYASLTIWQLWSEAFTAPDSCSRESPHTEPAPSLRPNLCRS